MKPLRFSWWALLAVFVLGGGLSLAVCALGVLPDSETVYIDVLSGRLKVVHRRAGLAVASKLDAPPDIESQLGYFGEINSISALYFLYHGSYPERPRWEFLESRTRWLGREFRRRSAWKKMLYLPDGVGMVCKGLLDRNQPRREITPSASAKFVEDWLLVLRRTPDASIPQRFLMATAERLSNSAGPITVDDLLDPVEFIEADLE